MARTTSYLMLISCLMCLSQGQGQEEQPQQPSPKNRCPEGTNAYGSYCYFFYQHPETWVDADLFCQNMHSGNLVSVINQAEGDFVASLIKESGTNDLKVWIGLHDPNKNRRWRWSSGSLFSYRSWVVGYPRTTNPGYCVILSSDSGYKKWKDESCEIKLSFVCKFKN
ncbi:lithostathine-1-alpha-like isoform X2 [Oryctolagus cuniculus]|uniref:lithostathine-1-alpha-like isoform X2 n=1 Tax=Oryctolagus cuniculus TaxID=9986 RepID=UPI0001C64C3C|nr:lithostathine-1-alpha-like [Oryctolagus cuniculus]